MFPRRIERRYFPERLKLTARKQVVRAVSRSSPRANTLNRQPITPQRLAFVHHLRHTRRPMPLPDLELLRLFLIGQGHEAWRVLGAHPQVQDGQPGWQFVVWAPNAQNVALIGDFCAWQPLPMTQFHQFWLLFVPGAQPGQRYKFQVTGADGVVTDRADPLAFFAELRPQTASVLTPTSAHVWRDHRWMQTRPQKQAREAPISIYELHAGSWRRHPDGRQYTWPELAEPLIAHVKALGFTHIQLLPVYEHPYDPSWGYQVTGYFAPTSRWGTPDEFRAFVDQLHQADIGVLLDWVPAHFPKDIHALGRFDGTPLYEHPDPRRGDHPDWGTWVFDYGRPEVQSFLLAAAHYWLESFHIDGFRVDAVASMLYLDYSRQPGQWEPNIHGGNWNLEAIDLLRQLNRMVANLHPGTLMIAEESTAFPGITAPPEEDGLGFDFKWNMGWMHDTLRYLSTDPLLRAHTHDKICFAASYAFSEAFVLPLSHDEVVHVKGSLWRKMAPENLRLMQLRQLFGYQWLHPGKKLLFMGGEFAQQTEWNADAELPWALAADPDRQALMRWIQELNRLYRALPALHEGDCHPDGFRWVEGTDAAASVLVTERRALPESDERPGKSVVVVLHFTPIWRRDYWLPLPEAGKWRFLLHTELTRFGGTLQKLPSPVKARIKELDRPIAHVDLPPMGVLVLEKMP